MKKVCVLLCIILCFHLSIKAQFKELNLKKVTQYQKPIKLRSFAIYTPEQQTKIYRTSGKIPGKAETGFLTYDETDKHSFLLMARYWNKQKRIHKNDDYALKLYAREFTPPKGYEGLVIDEKFYKEGEAMFYLRKYARVFNAKEQDTIGMVEVTYVAQHPNLKNEVIVFDLLMIGDHLEIAPAADVAKQFTNNIKPLNAYYDKKWAVTTDLNILYERSNNISTDLAHVIDIKSPNNANFGYASFNPSITAGLGLAVSRHLYKNIWVSAGASFYASSFDAYDSLYNANEVSTGHITKPVIYNVTYKTTEFSFITLGIEKRFRLNGRNFIQVCFNLKQSISSNNFNFTAYDANTGKKNNYNIKYNNPLGYDYCFKYQHCFKNHHWGLSGGFGYTYNRFSTVSFKHNGQSESIKTAPYFIPKISNLELSGSTYLGSIFYQF